MGASSPKEVLEPHVASGESPKLSHTSEDRTILGTDRRLLILEMGEEGDRAANRTHSILYDNITGIEINEIEPASPDYGTAAASLLLALFGGVIGFVGFSMSTSGTASDMNQLLGTIGIPVALALIGFSLYRAIKAFDTDPGHLSVTIEGAGLSRSLLLPQEDLDVAEGLSELVGKYHSP